ncbi:MAG: UpxY family transcription antiterminator [Candidatus Neomarinimicrobiota bacterium]
MNNNKSSLKWITLYTKPRHEKKVAQKLKEKNIQVYLPLLRKKSQWSDRKNWVEFPFFKSYLFAKSNLKDSIHITNTPGLIKIISFGNQVAIVQDKKIKALKMMLHGGYNPIPTDYFIKGDPVIVKDGPLKGIEGEVKRVDDNDRLILRIDSIQNSLSIKISRAFLKKL